jgi:hypothetical protein
MKPANVLWQELNHSKFACPICNFRTFNRAHFARHEQSDKHFLLTEFRAAVPRDMRVLIASFLPIYKIIRLKCIGYDALKLAWPRDARFSHRPRMLLPSLTFV